MGLLSFLSAALCSFETPHGCDPGSVDIADVNPATGLPMLCDTGIDVGGSPWATDIHSSMFDDNV